MSLENKTSCGMRNPNDGHRERLRRRFLECGGDALAPHELLELLLTFSIPRRDVKPVAKTLLERFGSIAAVLDADPSELRTVPGIGEVTPTLIRLVRELHLKHQTQGLLAARSLSTPAAVHDFVREKLSGRRDELFIVIYLTAKNKLLKVLDIETSAEGTVDQAAVYPRKIVRKALESNASALVLAHNHPSGDHKPSDDDLTLTRTITDACRHFDVRILDHIIVGDGGYYSFKENNLKVLS